MALQYNKEFVETISGGQLAGVVLDRTCFYAEQGGQLYDNGFLTKPGDEVRGRGERTVLRRWSPFRGCECAL